MAELAVGLWTHTQLACIVYGLHQRPWSSGDYWRLQLDVMKEFFLVEDWNTSEIFKQNYMECFQMI